MQKQFTFSNFVAILALVGVIASTVSTAIGSISPEWGTIIAAVGAGILAFTGRITGSPVAPKE